MRTLDNDGFACPHCGAIVPADAKFCRECGADDDVGWNDDSEHEADGYDDEFDYDEFVAREFPGQAPVSRSKRTTQVIGLILLLAFVAAIVSYLPH